MPITYEKTSETKEKARQLVKELEPLRLAFKDDHNFIGIVISYCLTVSEQNFTEDQKRLVKIGLLNYIQQMK